MNYTTFKNMVWFIGVVEDNYDLTKMGRVRVRCFNVHPPIDSGLVPTEDLPWAIPVNGTYNTDYKPPRIGAWVFGFFIDGEDCQHPMLIGTIPGMPTEMPASAYPGGEYGILDPCEVYEPELPRQARGEKIEDTDTAIKYAYLESDIENADGSKWSQPEPPYNTVYTHNQARVTESGHVLETDDTPGAERINIFHRTGTFTEMHPSGNKVDRIVGAGYKIVESSDHVYVKGAKHVTVEGNCNVYVKNDCNLKVDGNFNQEVHGDYNLSIGGNFNASIRGTSKTRASHLMLETAIEGIELYAAKDLNLFSTTNTNILSTETLSLESKTGANVKTKGNLNIASLSNLNLRAESNILQTGSEIHLNGPEATMAQQAQKANMTLIYEPAMAKTPVKRKENETPTDGTYRERHNVIRTTEA